jgi:hypothetical protein
LQKTRPDPISTDPISTRAACPLGSLEQDYIRDLNAAAIYFFKADALYVNLKNSAGTMKFMN